MKKLIIISSVISVLFCGDISGVSYFNYATGDADAGEAHGFSIERAYLTYENNVSDKVSFKFRTDIKNSDDGGGWGLYLKNAKLDYVCKEDMIFTLGLQDMNMFSTQQKTWGNRFLAKSSMDGNGWSPAADLGMGVSKSFGDISGSFLYTNGEGYWNQSSDNNEKISLQAMYGEGDLSSNEGFNVGGVFSTLNYSTTTAGTCDAGCSCGDNCSCGSSGTCGCAGTCPGAGCMCGCAGDTASCSCDGSSGCGCGGNCTSGCSCGSTCGVSQTSDMTGQVMGLFGGFSGFGFRGGFEYNMGTDLDLDSYGASSSIMSFYGTYALSFVEGLSVLIRLDMVDADTDIENVGETQTLFAGLSYECAEGLTVAPNIVQTTVNADEPTTAMNLTFRINF